MEIYRITTPNWADKLQASGFAGRWNSNGVPVIYAASSRSLACLENVVHRNRADPGNLFRVVVIFVPDSLKVEMINIEDLPDGWYRPNEVCYEICRKYGDSWATNNSSALLSVPSAIVRNERNFLLNPNHPDFSQVKLVDVEPFLFDPRIKTQ